MTAELTLWELRLQKATRSGLIKIRNDTDHALLREPLQQALFGEFVSMPPEQIAARSEVRFGIVNRKIMTGCEIEVAFVDLKRPHLGRICFHVDVNYIGDNRAFSSQPPQFAVQVEHNGVGAHNFEVTFIVRDLTPRTHLQVQNARAGSSASAGEVGAAPKSPRATPSGRVAVEGDDWKQQLKKAQRSVFVAVNNRTPIAWTRRMCDVYHGAWRRAPPETLPPNATIEFATESNAALTGTDGRAVYEAADKALTLVIAWDLPFLKEIDATARASLPTVAVLKYQNAGHHADVVFELSPNDGLGKPVFGFPYREIVAGHGGAVLPRPLLDVVCEITRHGTTAANRGLFTGCPSFIDLKELRSAIIVDRSLDLARFSPASLGAIVKAFLVELHDRPLAPLLAAYGGGDPSSAGTAEARLLLKVLIELFASVSVAVPRGSVLNDEPSLGSSGALPPAVAVQSLAADENAAFRPLSSHELAIIFAPILASSPSEPRQTLREQDDALKAFRENVAVLHMLIDTQIQNNNKA